MKKIRLTQDKFALVDDADFDELNELKWCAVKGNAKFFPTFYAVRGISNNGKQFHYFMHRVILGIVDSGRSIQVDHIDHNGLNNQRSNLRIANHYNNAHNTIARFGGSSKFLGVGWCKRTKLWQAQIRDGYKQHHLGRYKTEIEAAKVRDAAAIKFHGEFATLNFP